MYVCVCLPGVKVTNSSLAIKPIPGQGVAAVAISPITVVLLSGQRLHRPGRVERQGPTLLRAGAVSVPSKPAMEEVAPSLEDSGACC